MRIAVVGMAMCLAVGGLANAQANDRQLTNISAQDLNSALQLLGRERALQVVYRSDVVGNLRSPGASGELTSDEAMEQLLKGTGLTFHHLDDRTVTIVPRTTVPTVGLPAPNGMTALTEPVTYSDGAALTLGGPFWDRTSASIESPAEGGGTSTGGPGTEGPAAQNGTSDTLDEVIVTAQRRAERLQDVPITLTAINAEQIERNNVQKLSDITALTPAVRIDYEGSFAQPTIRGVGTDFVATGTGSNVGLYIDGFYSPNALAADFELLNVQSIEVLKGPQGTLFGRNSTGGAFLVNTSEPTQDFHGKAEVSDGSYSTQRYQAYVTGGVDHFAVDVSGMYTRSRGYVDNLVTGSEDDGAYRNWAFRVGAKATLTDQISFLFRYSHSDMNDPTAILTNAYTIKGAPQTLASALNIPGVQVATTPNDLAETTDQVSRLKTDTYQLTGDFDFHFATLRSYTQYRQDQSYSFMDEDFSSAPIFSVGFSSIDRIFTQELILTSPTEQRLQWTAGAFYLDWTDRFPAAYGYVGGAPAALLDATYADTWSAAAFADATYEVIDNLFLTAGARYTHDVVAKGHFVAGAFLGGPFEIFYPTLKNDRVTPRAVVRYKLSDSSSVFLSYTQGYKAGLINMSGPPDRTIKPEKLDSYEVGYKYVTRPFTLDLSAYYYNYRDLQSAINLEGVNVYTNAATSRIFGFEGQVSYQVTQALDVSAAAAYLNAKYRNYPTAVGFSQCLAAACGAGFGSFLQTTVDATGFEMQRAPKFTGNLSARYSKALPFGKVSLSGTFYQTSGFYFDTSEQYPQASYNTLGLRLEWTDPSDRYTLAIYGDNVTDSHYLRQVLTNTFGAGAVWAEPASVNGSIRVRF
jgi:iron complex outermembrane recepter protein